jgi:N-acetylmuramoyl-L-alanine amidase
VRRALGVGCALAFGLFAPGALAAPPAITASATSGAAPLAVTLTASGEAHWDFGDGSSADGAVVEHTYAAGSWTATATVAGESATVAITAGSVTLAGPRAAQYGAGVSLRGAVVPAAAGTPVALYSGSREVAVGTTAANGSFRLNLKRLGGPGPFVARTALAASAPVTIAVHPQVSVAFTGSGIVGKPFALTASLRPASAGSLRITIWRGGSVVARLRRGASARVPLGTRRAASYRAQVAVVPASGYLGARRLADTAIVDPNLSLGARGPSVRALEQRLAAMHYALQRVDGLFGGDTYEAVLAFEKVHGLPRTGRVDGSLWQRIATSSTPAARYPGNHVEVDKARQVLFEVRDGKVVLVVHVSTGATGNTPLGRWQIYRRVTVFDWVLYYPTYFLRGFAIHGYPSVPAYPASHGCVRVPMWVAPRLYEMNQYDEDVYVYV